jgi:hypothetical protein
MRFRLRTLMIVLTLGPAVLAAIVYVAASIRYWANYNSALDDQGPPPTFHRPSP